MIKPIEDLQCEVCKYPIAKDRYVVVQSENALKVVHRDCHDTWVSDSK